MRLSRSDRPGTPDGGSRLAAADDLGAPAGAVAGAQFSASGTPPDAGTVPAALVRAHGIRSASTLRGGAEHLLPVHSALRELLPDGGLRRGSTLAVAAATGGTSLLFALLATASRAGAWCAMVGVPEAGAVSATEFGMVCERLALVPDPGPDWLTVTAALLDGFDLVVVRPAGPIPVSHARRLAGRVRHRRAVLLAHGDWPGAEVLLRPEDPVWQGLGDGRGRLRQRSMTVAVAGRGVAARPRTAQLLLPTGAIGTAAIAPAPSTGAAAAPSVPTSRPAVVTGRPDDAVVVAVS